MTKFLLFFLFFALSIAFAFLIDSSDGSKSFPGHIKEPFL
jgi:hypothetical protein